MIKLFVAMFINTALLILIVNADLRCAVIMTRKKMIPQACVSVIMVEGRGSGRTETGREDGRACLCLLPRSC